MSVRITAISFLCLGVFVVEESCLGRCFRLLDAEPNASIRFELIQNLCKLFNIRPGLFHCTATIEVCGPRWCLGQRFGRIFIEHLGHHCNQITDNARVFDEGFNNRVGKTRLFDVEIVRRLVFGSGFCRHFVATACAPEEPDVYFLSLTPTATVKRKFVDRSGDFVRTRRYQKPGSRVEMFISDICERDRSAQLGGKHR